jgi:non-specific serine/threonine protein kinase
VRQQTLRATIDWSYNLLEPWEQMLLGRLSVFVSGCTLEAAEAICAELRIENEELRNTMRDQAILNSQFSILNSIEALVDKSLLRQNIGLEGEPRFVMLETIREYALERLMASGEWVPIRRKHAEAFLALAESAAAALEGVEQGAWLGRLQQEHDNLRAALDWAVAQQEVAIGLRLATALRLFWFMRGYLTEGRERLAQVLALGNGSASARARALDCAGFLARYQGDYAAAASLISEGLALWRSLGHYQGVADALSNLGYVTLHQGDYATARTLYAESLDLQRDLGNAQGRADCLSHLGTAAFYQGDEATALTLHEESLAIWRGLGDVEGVAYALYHLGDVAVSQDNLAGAARWFAEGLAASVELGWPWGIVSAVEGAAGLAALGGRPHIALRLAGFTAQLRKTVAIPLSAARAQILARRLAPARRALSESETATAWAEGESLTLEQAVAASFAELAIGEATAAAAAGPPSPISEAFGGLTAREREVVTLIAAGNSNRAIAAALVVGVKTVEAHITRILTKLAFSSRTQIAAWAVAQGLASAPEELEARMRPE